MIVISFGNHPPPNYSIDHWKLSMLHILQRHVYSTWTASWSMVSEMMTARLNMWHASLNTQPALQFGSFCSNSIDPFTAAGAFMSLIWEWWVSHAYWSVRCWLPSFHHHPHPSMLNQPSLDSGFLQPPPLPIIQVHSRTSQLCDIIMKLGNLQLYCRFISISNKGNLSEFRYNKGLTKRTVFPL